MSVQLYWNRLVEKTLSHYRHELLFQHVDSFNIFDRIFVILNKFESKRILIFDDFSTISTLYFEAHFIFDIASDEDCIVDNNIKTISILLQLNVQFSTSIVWNETSFRQWIKIENENTTKNYISILTLNWFYFFSVRLFEMQNQKDIEITYTQSMTIEYKREIENKIVVDITVNIDDMNENVARWWVVILTFDEDWKTIVSRKDDVIYLSSWLVCVENEQRFDIIWEKKSSSSQNFLISTFLSFKNVFELLIKFCLSHDLSNQCFVIFATTLIFLTCNHYEIVVTLSFLVKMRDEDENNSMKLITSNLI